MKRLKLSLVVLLSLVSFGFQTFADQNSRQEQKLNTLRKSRNRPSVEEIQKALKPWPRKSPFGESWITPKDRRDEKKSALAARKVLANAIASMEKAYPGGTYAFLGRDAATLGQAFDAFYRSIGQNDRVILLNASGPTIDNASEATLVKFLKTNGLTLQNVAKAHPYIIIDTTPYSEDSQSRTIIRAFYNAYKNSGGDVRNLVRKVAVVDDDGDHTRIRPSTNLEKFFEKEEKGVLTETEPPEILSFPTSDRGNLTYSDEWHDSFGQFYTRDGKTQAALGTNNPENHNSILDHMYYLISVVKTRDFRKMVYDRAEFMGFRFPRNRAAAPVIPTITAKSKAELEEARKQAIIEAADQELKSLRKDFVNEVASLDKVSASAGMSANASSLSDTLDNQQYYLGDSTESNPALYLFNVMKLTEAVYAFQRHKLSKTDLAEVIRALLGGIDYKDSHFREEFLKLYQESPELREAWIGKKDIILRRTAGYQMNDGAINAYRSLNQLVKKVRCQVVMEK